jgi:hypothetical protein
MRHLCGSRERYSSWALAEGTGSPCLCVRVFRIVLGEPCHCASTRGPLERHEKKDSGSVGEPAEYLHLIDIYDAAVFTQVSCSRRVRFGPHLGDGLQWTGWTCYSSQREDFEFANCNQSPNFLREVTRLP